MSIKPILFNTDMVRAILAGWKTVTRRVVKPQPAGDGSAPEPLITRPGYWNARGDDFVYRQPYLPGDILYVRETWQFIRCFDCKGSERCRKVPQSHYDRNIGADGCYIFREDTSNPERELWRPSIHMPKEAARIFLRVTDVRVERLQDITEFGAKQEGILLPLEARNDPEYAEYIGGYYGAFRELWGSTIKPADRAIYGWAANPWVWVIEFERISREEMKL